LKTKNLKKSVTEWN